MVINSKLICGSPNISAYELIKFIGYFLENDVPLKKFAKKKKKSLQCELMICGDMSDRFNYMQIRRDSQ